MATVKFYHDCRGLKKNQEAPLKIKITNKGVGAYINIGVKILPSQWNEKRLKVVNHPQEENLNIYIRKKELDVEEIVRELPALMTGKQMADSVKKRFEMSSEGYKSENLFTAVFKRYADSRNAFNTQRSYLRTLVVMRQYDNKVDSKVFEDIDVEWLEGFEKYLTEVIGITQNSRFNFFKTICAVFNYARKDLEITQSYPFYKFKFSLVETRKRSVPLEQIREIALSDKWKDNKKMQRYIDIFLLAFFLRGIRPIDLIQMKKENVVNGRLDYVAHKSTKGRPLHYSVKIEPEAKELIEKHYGKGEFLLDVMDKTGNYNSSLSVINRNLKKVLPELSLYWARHSWATIAVNLGVPIETVSAGLGHLHGIRTTLVYIAFNQKKVDDANRMIIDSVLGKTTPS